QLHARALDDPSATRGLVSGDWTTLVRAELRAGAPPAAVHALVEGLRVRFDHPPDLALAVSARAWAERELELDARRGLARGLPLTLAGLALRAGVALASVRAGVLVSALAGAAVLWCVGVASWTGIELGAGAAGLASAIAAAAAAGALALVYRIRLERRGACS